MFCVLVSIVEAIFEMVYLLSDGTESSSMANVRIMRILRVSRLFRTLRITRLVRFSDALRTLVLQILATMRTVVWAATLLLLIIYIFGLLFVQGVAERKENLGTEWVAL